MRTRANRSSTCACHTVCRSIRSVASLVSRVADVEWFCTPYSVLVGRLVEFPTPGFAYTYPKGGSVITGTSAFDLPGHVHNRIPTPRSYPWAFTAGHGYHLVRSVLSFDSRPEREPLSSTANICTVQYDNLFRSRYPHRPSVPKIWQVNGNSICANRTWH